MEYIHETHDHTTVAKLKQILQFTTERQNSQTATKGHLL